MTFAEIEAAIRSITRTCKGPNKIAVAQRELLHKRWQHIEGSRNWAAAVTFKRALEKSLSQGDAPIPADNWEAMLSRCADLMFNSREGCGYDVNNIVVSSPFDGVQRTECCPKCGIEITYVSPIFDLE